MMKNITKIEKLFAAAFIAAVVSSCGGDSSSNDLAGGRSNTGKGLLSLKITDAAVDSIAEVWIQINSITLKHMDKAPQVYPLSTQIDLLTLQGEKFQKLFDAIEVPSGNYEWIRINVSASLDGLMDSYVVLDDSTPHELSIPSGSQTGLQINDGLTVSDNGHSSLVIDFDLRKSIVIASGEYLMKPVLRLVDDDSGVITGSVTAASLASVSNCSDTDPNTYNAVYVYSGSGITPDDIRGAGTDPITSAAIAYNAATGQYEYTIGFVPYGDYTVTYTCQSDLDNPETDENLVFFGTHNVSVSKQVIVIR